MMKKTLSISLFIVAGLIVTNLGTIYLKSPTTNATSMKNFDPGNIISDAVFYDNNSMSAKQIQKFLNNKMPNCDTKGSQPYGRTGKTVKQYWTPRGEPAPYTCLKDYKQKTPTMSGSESGICGYIKGQKSRTAAQIIKDVGNACGISPKVLLVLLDKEQALVTDNSPLNLQYRDATGMGCPDTAGCDPKYDGFFNQVYGAARQYKLYRANPTNYNYVAGRSNYIQYNPNKSCGGSWIKIKNQATAGLYDYTPYQPNKATRNAPLGGTVHCGAYGNKNFFLYFSNWFGSTHLKFSSMKTPRWMQTKTDVYKKIPGQPEDIDTLIPAGVKIYFAKKVSVNDDLYLQTKHDQENGLGKGILYSDLEKVPLNYASMTQPRWMTTKMTVYKYNLLTKQKASGAIPANTTIFYETKFTIGGITYVRTRHDTQNDNKNAIRLSDLSETTLKYTSMTTPRWLQARTNTSIQDIKTSNSTGPTIPKGTHQYFDHKIEINGSAYLSEGTPPDPTVHQGVRLTNLKEIPQNYQAMKKPRQMKIKIDTYKKNPMTEERIDDLLNTDQTIRFSEKFMVGGKLYLRTTHDTNRGYNKAILFDDLVEL